MNSVGLFGGTFDPPHLGHVTVAADVADTLELDRLLWMPAARSPFKAEGGAAPPELRLAMVEAACALDPRFEARPDEIRRGGTSYTVDTLRRLREELGHEVELYLLLGADQLAGFARWRDPEEILRLCRLAIMDREGTDAPGVAPDLPGMERAVHVPVTRVDISSTAVRAAASEGASLTGLVPEGVRAVVEQAGLYR